MKFSARLENHPGSHEVTLKVGEKEQFLSIAPKPTGGSSVTGGELLFLAIATCYCNDIYREAAAFNIQVERVEIEVEGISKPPESRREILFIEPGSRRMPARRKSVS